jgi:peptide chain release factor 2
MLSDESIWQDREKSTKLLKEKSRLSKVVDTYRALRQRVEDAGVLLEMAQDEEDASALEETADELQTLDKDIARVRLETLLSDEHDSGGAFVNIHPGAGGTESQDWAEMLLRMYLRWAEARGYCIRIVDKLAGDEAGIKNVTFSVEGEYAFGYLKNESGVHRLVRISPFDANKRRHTSFASVFIYPIIDDSFEVEINPKDLRIDTYRSKGAGGQHVNVTDSAVRITHVPSGIVAQCQNERSQHQNKEMAMKILRARLYEYQKDQRKSVVDELHEGKKDIAWGNQIRSYVFQPYQLVKDHRTDTEVGNVQGVMDGNIDIFINSALEQQAQKQ